jgi:RNA polymerase sigma factor (TIGR02999 family)
MVANSKQITALLTEIRNGNRDAKSRLLNLVHAELHRIALFQMRSERRDHTLQPTALVNEAYLRLLESTDRTWNNRAHFLAVAARVMRNILVDYARRRRTEKHGGHLTRIQIEDIRCGDLPKFAELLALDEALDRLAAWDPQQSRIVELRFFAGLTEEEIAEVLGVSVRTVKRGWSAARAWLYSQISSAAV